MLGSLSWGKALQGPQLHSHHQKCFTVSVGSCLQVVEVSARYDDTCISGSNPSQRDANLVQVLDVAEQICSKCLA